MFPSLSSALGFTGIVGIGLPFIVTPLLALTSLREGREMWGRKRFDKAEADAGYVVAAASPPPIVCGIGLVGLLLLLYCVACGLLFGF